MKKIITALLILAASTAYATGFLSGERTSGMKKICYYDTLSGTVAITISAVELCPLTIDD